MAKFSKVQIGDEVINVEDYLLVKDLQGLENIPHYVSNQRFPGTPSVGLTLALMKYKQLEIAGYDIPDEVGPTATPCVFIGVAFDSTDRACVYATVNDFAPIKSTPTISWKVNGVLKMDGVMTTRPVNFGNGKGFMLTVLPLTKSLFASYNMVSVQVDFRGKKIEEAITPEDFL